MQTYVAFLRGVNVGGKALIKMADLTTSLEAAGLTNVRTFIQSGNVLFSAVDTNEDQLAALIANTLRSVFSLQVGVAVFTAENWRQVVADAPKWWGTDDAFKHNMLILIKPYDTPKVLADIGVLKPDIEQLQAGGGVLYQAVSWQHFGRATSAKLAGKPVYKQMTVRNYNTATKIAALLGN